MMTGNNKDSRRLNVRCDCEIDDDSDNDDMQHRKLQQRLMRHHQPRTLKYYIVQQKRLWIYLLSVIVTVILAIPSIVRRIVIVNAFTIPITVKRSLEKIIIKVAQSPRSGEILRTMSTSKRN